MHQSSALERVALVFLGKVRTGKAPQFSVDDRDQLLKRGLIAATPAFQQNGYVGLFRHLGC